jgi:5-methylcytosine-specific restriction endonuclease McrA
MRKFSRHINWRDLIFERDNFTCYICGKKFDKKQLEVDHVFPLSKGGDNSFNNLGTTCISCNRSKHNSIYKIEEKRDFSKHINKLNEMLKEKDKQIEMLSRTLNIAQDTAQDTYNKLLYKFI